MKVVIIGNGIAGISVAREIRALESARGTASAAAISVIAREAYPYYSRIRLPEVLDGATRCEAPPSAESLAPHRPAWYAEKGIEVLPAREVVAIDREGRTVMLATGEEVGYDALVLASGSEPVRPQVPGSALPGVFTIREYDDAIRVRTSASARPDGAAVVGGGLLGLEAARHLQAAGVRRVTVIEIAQRLLPRQLDGTGAALLAGELARMGIDVAAGARLVSFGGQDRLESTVFEAREGSRSLETGTAVVSMGVRPRLGLAKAAGLAVARGIVVDRFLRTSDPCIYAVGDCAEFSGAVPGIIPAALAQAPCCAAAILGDESRPYGGVVPSNTIKVVGIDVFSAGVVDDPGDQGLEELRLGPESGRYERYLRRDGVLVGAIVIGSKERSRRILARMGGQVDVAELEDGF
jgi:nitrite reductase (NADH) large subunit